MQTLFSAIVLTISLSKKSININPYSREGGVGVDGFPKCCVLLPQRVFKIYLHMVELILVILWLIRFYKMYKDIHVSADTVDCLMCLMSHFDPNFV